MKPCLAIVGLTVILACCASEVYAQGESNAGAMSVKPQPRPLTEGEANEVRQHNLDPSGMKILAHPPVLRAPTQQELEYFEQQGVDMSQLPPKLLFASPDADPALRALIEKAEKADTVPLDLRNAIIYLNSFLGMTNAVLKVHIISMKSETLKFRMLGNHYEYSGNFTVLLAKPREHKKPLLGLRSPETANLVTLENFAGNPFALTNATIWEKGTGFIDLVAMDQEWIYSGRYTIQN